MTNTVISAKQARDNFSDVLGKVYYGEEVVTIEKKGKPYAVLINPEQYEAFQEAAKDRLFHLIDQVHDKNAAIPEDEVLDDITQAVENVRLDQYEKGE